jgi:hypothetical protein
MLLCYLLESVIAAWKAVPTTSTWACILRYVALVGLNVVVRRG